MELRESMGEREKEETRWEEILSILSLDLSLYSRYDQVGRLNFSRFIRHYSETLRKKREREREGGGGDENLNNRDGREREEGDSINPFAG